MPYTPITALSPVRIRQAMILRKVSLTLLPAVVLLTLFDAAQAVLHRDALISTPSPSGRFVLESVSLAPWSDLAYLRISDTQDSQHVFRTPLYERQSADMRPYEDDRIVGTHSIDFDKQQKTFAIGAPGWRDSWLNLFISNTPYRVIEN